MNTPDALLPTAAFEANQLLDELQWGVLLVGPDTTIKQLNQAAATWWGQPAAATIGRLLGQVGTGQLSAAAYTQLQQLAAGQLAQAECWLPDGQRCLALTSASRPTGERLIFWADVTAPRATEQAQRRSEERQAFLLQLSDALRPLSEPEDIRATAMRLMGQHLGVNRAAYVDAERNPDAMSVISTYTQGVTPWGGRIKLADFGAALGEDYQQGKTVAITDVQTDARFADSRATYAALEIGAAVGVPLFKGGQIVAAMGVHNKAPRNWTPNEISLIEGVAERTWAAVERARAEQALRSSEEQFRTVANLVPDLLWRSIPTSGTTWYNQQWYEYTGQTPADAFGDAWTDVIHPEDQAESSRHYQAALADGQPLQREHRIRSAQGEYRWFQVHARPVRDSHGEITAWFGAATDIHAHKLAELRLRHEAEVEEHYRAQLEQQVAERTHQLRDSRDLLQSVLNAGLVAVAVFQAVRTATGTIDDFVFKLVNREQERLSGRTDLVGQYYTQLYPGIQQTGIWENLLQVMETGQPRRAELYYPYEGFNRWFEYQFVQLGEGVVAMTLDITVRKKAEVAAQHQRQQQLEAVLEGQEEERRRIAESLHNGIGQVLYATKLQLDQLPPRPDEPGWAEAQELLADAIRQTRAVSHELTPAVLADFGLQKALEMICQQLHSPSLHWHCYIDLEEAPGLPAVLQQAIYRLVQGLAHNVAKHAQASEATIEVTALPDWLVLHLEDNGQGFDPATVQGGLGLTTLYSRVALLAGRVQIDSAPGKGTRIQVRLPLSGQRDLRK